MNFSSFFNYPTETGAVPEYNLAFWANHSQRDWRKLLARMETYRYQRGDVVVEAGERGDGFYVVGFGRFQTPTGTIEEGQALGIQPFLDRHPHPHTITAQTDGELLYLSRDAFNTFAAHEPELARDILFELGRILSLQLRSQR